MFKEEGALRADIRSVQVKASDFALLHHELHMIRDESWIWNSYGTIAPRHVMTYQGVPIVSVYERPATRKGKTAKGAGDGKRAK
jgi:hypothetical protein